MVKIDGWEFNETTGEATKGDTEVYLDEDGDLRFSVLDAAHGTIPKGVLEALSEFARSQNAIGGLIRVNGTAFVITNPALSYETIALQAGYSGSGAEGLSMTWRRTDGTHGVLTSKQTILVSPGMVFNAYRTSNA